jgi:hypothetical protein
MGDLLEYVIGACWLIGAVGLIGVFILYSTPAHLDLPALLAIAGVSGVLIVVGFVIRNWRDSKFR